MAKGRKKPGRTLLVIGILAVFGCAVLARIGPQEEVESPAAATSTEEVVAVALPTRTAPPTNTPRPSRTPSPTETPAPSDTPGPSPTPTETPIPTETPLPTATPTPRPTNTPRPTRSPAERLGAAIREALGDGNRDVPRVEEVAFADGNIDVYFAINDNLTSGFIVRGAQLDVVSILEAVSKAGVDYEWVYAIGSFSMVDAYGNAREQVVVSMGYTRSTIDKINWDNFLTDNIYVIADEVLLLHPEFRP